MSEILWVKDPNPAQPYLRGSGIGEALADELDTDEYAAAFIKSFFANGALPDTIIGIKGATKSQLEQIEQAWVDDHRGPSKAHRFRMVNAELDIEKLTDSFEDQQIVQLREFLRNTIVQTFGVPPEVLGVLENSNKSTISAAIDFYTRLTIVPRLERLRIAWQRQLVPQFDENLILDFVNPIPADKEFEASVLRSAPWAATRAEVRDLINLRSHGEVDNVYMQPVNMFERPVVEDGGFEPMGTPPNGDQSIVVEGWKPPRQPGDTPEPGK
jgi:HK97 family phage portal protein